MTGFIRNTPGENINAQMEAELARLAKGHLNVADAQKKGAGAARTMANELINLAREAKLAEAALELSGLDLERVRIQESINARREHLEVNKRDTIAANALLNRIESAMLQQALKDHNEARYQADKQWHENHKRVLAQIEQAEKVHNAKLLEDYLRMQAQKEGDAGAAARAALAAQDVKNEMERAKISALGAIEEEKVAKAFGHASDNERIFNLQLRATQQLAKGNIFGGLITSIRAWNAELIQSGGYAQIWSNAITGAFDAAFNNGQSFLKSFGKLLIAGLLQVYGQAAIASGTYHIAEGIARMATIWDFAGGAKEFAAGTALVALGGAMTAAAGALTNSVNQQKAAGGGAAAVAASSGDGGASAQRREPVENRVRFATSGDSANAGIHGSTNRPQTVNNIYLPDPETTKEVWSKQFDRHMKNKGVIMKKSKREVRDMLKDKWFTGVR
jgi:hypothetical protein